jgi:hypothetical protein
MDSAGSIKVPLMGSCIYDNNTSDSIKRREYHEDKSKHKLLKKDSIPWNYYVRRSSSDLTFVRLKTTTTCHCCTNYQIRVIPDAKTTLQIRENLKGNLVTAWEFVSDFAKFKHVLAQGRFACTIDTHRAAEQIPCSY